MRNKGIPYIFRGFFKKYILKYIDFKRSLGFKVGSSVYYTLKGMDDFFLEYDLLSDSLI
jgi:integrase/recombinase XerD